VAKKTAEHFAFVGETGDFYDGKANFFEGAADMTGGAKSAKAGTDLAVLGECGKY
jgi:hypothetical protein